MSKPFTLEKPLTIPCGKCGREASASNDLCVDCRRRFPHECPACSVRVAALTDRGLCVDCTTLLTCQECGAFSEECSEVPFSTSDGTYSINLCPTCRYGEAAA